MTRSSCGVAGCFTCLVLAAYIPNRKAQVFVLDGFHIETCRGRVFIWVQGEKTDV